jgi:hypothetical protein
VAVVASRGAVDEVRNTIVLVRGHRFLVGADGMAVDAGEARIVCGSLMAIVANRAVMRNREVGVVVAGAQPIGRRVATVASSGKSRGDVIGNRAAEGLRAVPLRLMTCITNRVGRGERIVVVHVAIGAGLHPARGGDDVAARERPSGGRVVELAVGPADGVVAGGTHRSGKLRGDMVGHRAADGRGAIPVRKVAAGVVAICDRETVIVAEVALIAVGDHARGRHLMIARQGPARRCVIPRSGGERRGCRMAIRAVRPGKHRTRIGMHGIIGLLPIIQMASGISAIVGSDVEVVIVVDVATNAGNVGVLAGQKKSCDAVIELYAKPTVEIVAALAIGDRKIRAGSGVIGIRGVLPILQVARVALRRKPVENSGGELRVAGVALHSGMRAEKREAILVIPHLLHRDVPTLDGVALRAIRTHLPAVNVRVTVRAVLPDIRENRLRMA